ncbi:hypothetical protein PHLGIDRAFT_74520 [Phlebiopsis gigantea 11061_1 CR5-6]|uniref:Copper transport protein n=1 Tax=Phlebiopsis gigantea (strain 11061_1 CR5-6) TaxID=745531 RepID=A0A0C3S8F6_PHLG1|nr:hypothetical protein PHLGIDRAFT_74520 [Phlebiopsis gigantea 11061_1 CR5-6]
MKMYLHFTPGDMLIFATVAPTSAGAVFGACLIFFLLSVFYRWLRAFHRGLDIRLAERSRRLVLSHVDSECAASIDASQAKRSVVDEKDHQWVPQPPTASRFLLSSELRRGALTGVEEVLHYLLMLIVMMFNASYIISIILGAVVGEVAFGRLHRG